MPPTTPQANHPRLHHRGRVRPANLEELIKASHEKHGARLRALVTPTAPSFDWRTLGKVPPVEDQGQCGSCWDFSGCGTATCAQIQVGAWPADGSMAYSPQYYLDCVQDGGCNGDDNTTVLQDIEANGAPTEAEYGPYAGDSQRCNTAGTTTKYKISGWGFADSNGGQGVTSTADIKEALATYGPVGCAVAAGDDWDEYTGGVSAGSGSTDINHDVMIVGWQDDATLRAGGYWIVRNSWGTEWGESGYMRLQYGADQIGTETVFAQASPTPVPGPTPGPTPPAPTPPTPTPTPSPLPATTGTFDTASKAFTLPAAGFSVPLFVVLPNNQSVLFPKGWTVSTPAGKSKGPLHKGSPTAIDWATILGLIAQYAPTVIQIIIGLLPASASARKLGTSASDWVETPEDVEDLLLNADVLTAITAAVTAEITDPVVLANILVPIAAEQQALLEQGAAAVLADTSLTQPLPPISHNGLNYEVNSSVTPPVLAVVATIPANSVPLPPTPPPSS
jgi:hypothetical protein